jgi:hypothetical protein
MPSTRIQPSLFTSRGYHRPSRASIKPIRVNESRQGWTCGQDGMSDSRWLLATTASLMRSFLIVMLLKFISDGFHFFQSGKCEDL